MPEIPFCNPPKNPIFITVSCLKRTHFFHRIMWASSGFLWLGQSFAEKTGKQEPSHSPLYLSSLVTTLAPLDLIFSFIISCPSLSLSPFSLKLSLTFYFFYLSHLSPFIFLLLSIKHTKPLLCFQFLSASFYLFSS